MNTDSKNAETKQCTIPSVSSSDTLILLKRESPLIYEVHRGEIRREKNIILTTKDKDFAERLVNGYNHYC